MPQSEAGGATSRLTRAITGTLTERATAALDAVANGDLAPDTAAQLIQSVATLARVVEIDEMMQRVARLEKHTGVTDTGENQW